MARQLCGGSGGWQLLAGSQCWCQCAKARARRLVVRPPPGLPLGFPLLVPPGLPQHRGFPRLLPPSGPASLPLNPQSLYTFLLLWVLEEAYRLLPIVPQTLRVCRNSIRNSLHQIKAHFTWKRLIFVQGVEDSVAMLVVPFELMLPPANWPSSVFVDYAGRSAKLLSAVKWGCQFQPDHRRNAIQFK